MPSIWRLLASPMGNSVVTSHESRARTCSCRRHTDSMEMSDMSNLGAIWPTTVSRRTTTILYLQLLLRALRSQTNPSDTRMNRSERKVAISATASSIREVARCPYEVGQTSHIARWQNIHHFGRRHVQQKITHLLVHSDLSSDLCCASSPRHHLYAIIIM